MGHAAQLMFYRLYQLSLDLPTTLFNLLHNHAGIFYLEQAQVIPLYQVKAFLKRKVSVVTAKKEIEDLLSLAKQKAPVPKQIKKPANVTGGMLEVNLTDHHFGKMSWQLETMGANYDSKIAIQVFNRAFDTILNRSPFSTYDEIWFVVGNDLFNADNALGTTTAGTQVE